MQDFGVRIQPVNDLFQLLQIVRGNQIGFVDDDHICKFNLIDKQVDNVTVIFVTDSDTTISQIIP